MAIRVIKGFSLLAGAVVTASVSYFIYSRFWQKLLEEIAVLFLAMGLLFEKELDKVTTTGVV